MTEVRIDAVESNERPWISGFISEQWGDEIVVAHGAVYRPHELPGFIARDGRGEPIGFVSFAMYKGACEIVTLNSVQENRGVGTALIEAVVGVAKTAACSRIWLITTNDNLHALGFYQRRGFVIKAVHPNALERSRQLKPSIPLVSENGIPLRDEIELERLL